MRKFLLAAAVACFAVSPALATQCRDAKGKFTKCPTASAKAMAPAVTKDAKGKCRFASGPKKGQFTKCPK